MEQATFGGGCFWGVEAAFRQVKGVHSTSVGFMGGHLRSPSYKDVCTGRTGHAEVVHVVYDPARISYADLLSVFWQNHDPTTLDRQGPDVGPQYRSVIFFHTAQQEVEALASKSALEAGGSLGKNIVTQIVPAGEYYLAEDDHQQYLEKRGLSSCNL